jgi:hypothetical protein
VSRDHHSAACAHVAGQLLTAVVVAGFGLVGVLMHRDGQLDYILARPFHGPVLVAGWAVLALVALRLVCGGRDCGHDHDHGWTYSRLAVLSFPVGLFLIGVPNTGFSEDRIRALLGADDTVAFHLSEVASRNGTVTAFRELAEAAQDAESRARMEGQTAVVDGRVSVLDDRQFTLYRLKMTCCAADVVPQKVRVVLKTGTLSGYRNSEWVRLTGRVRFVPAPNSEQFIPVVMVDDVADVVRTAAGSEYD